MNKQEAIQYILQELGNHRSRDEIAAELSQQLNAPPDLVSKFVSQVTSQRQLSPARPEQTTDQRSSTSLKPGTTGQPARPATRQSPAPPRPAANPVSSRQPQPIPPVEAPAVADLLPAPKPDELEAIILNALKKDRRHSDIVLDVCDQTGMSWDQAQRLVAQVATKNRKHLVSRQNMIIIPLATIALLAGLALVAASISEAQNLARQLTSDPSAIPAQASEVEYILQEGLWGFVIGISLFLGGVYGLIRALQSQFD